MSKYRKAVIKTVKGGPMEGKKFVHDEVNKLYLHPDGNWRESTRHGLVDSGYFDSELDIIKALNKQ